jgi:glycolate oxidase iron-sulfur subunit
VRDISEWLVQIGFRAPAAPLSGAAPVAVTYHEACHLCHGQKISAQPREILKSIPGVELRECAEATMCCGSAGVYSLTQPKTAGWLRDRKVGHLRATGATVVATANPGCQLQIQQGISTGGAARPRVVHPVVLLAEAYALEAKEF